MTTLPNYDAWREQPYLLADIQAAAYERWAMEHGGRNHDRTGLQAAQEVAAALLADHTDKLPPDLVADMAAAVAGGLFGANPEIRAEMGAALGLWSGADGGAR